MLTCLIVDDEQHAIDVLKHYIEQCNLLQLGAATTNAVEALNIVNTGKIDILFQDIHMPEVSGLDIVKAVGDKCNVILTTAYKNYAYDGYELGVIDYLLKPISYPRFNVAIQKVVEKMKVALPYREPALVDSIYVKTGLKNNVIKINFDEIEYIESQKNYVAFYHCGEKTLAYLSMKDLEATLPADKFIRVHKSFIVAFQKITRIESNEIILSNSQTRIVIGDSYKSNFWSIISARTLS